MSFAPLIYKLAKIYWFLIRPQMKGAKGVVYHENEILMVRQAYLPHLWSLPGGRIKRNETPVDAFKREVKEEVGIEVVELKELGSRNFSHEYKRDQVTFFSASVAKKDTTTNSYEIPEARWFPQNALPTNISPVTQTGLNFYFAKNV